MKTDRELLHDVRGELSWDPAVDAKRVDASVDQGVVTVTGQVDTLASKQAVEHAVRRVAGVRAIVMEVDVQILASHRRRDTEIACAAARALAQHGQLPADDIQIEVDNGEVVLLGKVETKQQRERAEQVVRPFVGLRPLYNRIQVAPDTQPAA